METVNLLILSSVLLHAQDIKKKENAAITVKYNKGDSIL